MDKKRKKNTEAARERRNKPSQSGRARTQRLAGESKPSETVQLQTPVQDSRKAELPRKIKDHPIRQTLLQEERSKQIMSVVGLAYSFLGQGWYKQIVTEILGPCVGKEDISKDPLLEEIVQDSFEAELPRKIEDLPHLQERLQDMSKDPAIQEGLQELRSVLENPRYQEILQELRSMHHPSESRRAAAGSHLHSPMQPESKRSSMPASSSCPTGQKPCPGDSFEEIENHLLMQELLKDVSKDPLTQEILQDTPMWTSEILEDPRHREFLQMIHFGRDLSGTPELAGRASHSQACWDEDVCEAIKQMSNQSLEVEDVCEAIKQMSNLSLEVENMGKGGEPLLHENKDRIAQLFGKQHKYYARALLNLGRFYAHNNSLKTAEGLYLESKGLLAQTLGTQNPFYFMAVSWLAGVYKDMGEFEKAKPLFLESVELVEQLFGKDSLDYAAELNNLAKLYTDMGNFESAMPLHLECVQLMPDNLGMLNNLANLYLAMGAFEKAKPLYLKSMELLEQLVGKNHPAYARVLNNLASLCANVRDFERAEQLYLNSKAIIMQTHGTKHLDYAEALGNLGKLYSDMGEFERAQPLFNQSRDLIEQLVGKQHPHYATALKDLAGLYRNLGDFKSAEQLYLEAKELRAQLLGNQHPHYAAVLNGLAVLYAEMCDFGKAMQLFVESKVLIVQLFGTEHPLYAEALNNEANVYKDMHEHEKALPLYLESKDIMARVHGTDHLDYAGVLHSLANLHHSKRDFERARQLYLESLNITQLMLGDQSRAYALIFYNFASNQVELCSDMEDFKSAEALLLKSKDLTAQTHGTRHPANAGEFQSLASLYRAQGDLERAFDMLTSAVEVQFQAMVPILPALPERRMLEYVKKLDATLQHMVAVVDDLAQARRVTDAQIEKCFDFVSSCKNIVFDAQMPVSGDPEDCDLLSAVRWKLSRLVVEDIRLLHQIRNPATLNDNLALVTSTDVEQEEAGTEFDRLLNELEQLQIKTGRAQQSRLGEYRADSRQMARQIAEALGAHRALAEYATTSSDRYVVFVVTPDPDFKVSMFGLGPVADIDSDSGGRTYGIDSQISELQDQLQLRMSGKLNAEERDVYRTPGKELRKRLLDPVTKVIGGATHLFVVPDGKIAMVPFAVLPQGKKSFVLNQSLNISNLFSSRDLLQERPPAQCGKSVVIANPAFDSTSHEAYTVKTASGLHGQWWRSLTETRGDEDDQDYFADLPHSEEEAKVVVRYLHDAEEPLIGQAASVKALLTLSRPRVLHVSTHGFCKPDDGTSGYWSSLFFSGLALAGANRLFKSGDPDSGTDIGIVTALDLLSMKLRGTELVTISACRSGQGPCQAGQGVLGLSRSLLLAGARHVVLALWDIPDFPTSKLMERFYYHALHEGDRTVHKYAEAMRKAQKDMLSEFGPECWGAFIVYGW